MTDEPYISVTSFYSIVVRRQALEERGVPWRDLLSALEVSGPLDSNSDLVSFGPHFDGEALDTMSKRLISMGLEYCDDFFEFYGQYPDWCSFKVGIAKSR